MKKIVVGIDGSPAAQEALDFACDEAQRWQANLLIVHAWNLVYSAADGFAGGAVSLVDMLESEARNVLEAAAAYAAARCKGEVAIETRLVQDSAAHALITEAKNADLIVVGSRGHGGFTSLLLGSTSHQVVHHATCPVVVIRGSEG